MKTTQEIAQVLLDRRNRMNPIIMSGEMLAALESEGMQEALQRRWLRPDADTGHLQVSTDMAVVEEMRAVAATPAPAPEASVRESASHGFAMAHAQRSIDELLAPGTGHDNSAPFKPNPPPTPASTAPQTSAPGIGDQVMVAQEGKTYQGTVGSIGQDGKYKVTFGNEKPPMARDYAANELKVTNKAGTTGTPTAQQ